MASNDENTEESLILVHCFANIENPVFYQGFFSFFERLLSYFGIQINGSATSDGISPVAQVLMKMFPSLVE